jgi:hypothetical protein
MRCLSLSGLSDLLAFSPYHPTCAKRSIPYNPLSFSNGNRNWTHNGTIWTNTNNYSESNITFDLNGNIKTYTRRGLVTAPSTYGVIDQLTYTYGDAARPDRLTNRSDAGSNTKGFFHTPAAAAYQYDLNGNMTQDNHKGITVSSKQVGKLRSDNHLKIKVFPSFKSDKSL